VMMSNLRLTDEQMGKREAETVQCL
jgi:hypothetical protein